MLTAAIIAAGIVVSLFAWHGRRKRHLGSLHDGPLTPVGTGTAPNDSIGGEIAEVPTRFMLGCSVDECALSFGTFEDLIDEARAKRLDVHSGGVSRLNPLLSLVPNALVCRAMTNGKFMEVIISGPLVRATSGEGWRAFTMGAKGIQEQALLVEPSKLSQMINGAALFQLASVVVAQKHLADISKKLDLIVDAVGRISDFLEDQQKARIRAVLIHLQQSASAVLNGELEDAVRATLEAHEINLIEIQDHIVRQLARAIEQTAHLKDPDTFGAEGLVATIEAHQKQLDGLVDQWMLCLRARCQAWFLLSAFPNASRLKEERLESIKKSIRDFGGDRGPLMHSHRAISVRIENVDAVFNWKSTLDGYKAKLRKMSNDSLALKQNLVSVEQSSIAGGDLFLLEQQEPLRLAIRIDGGRVVEALHVEPLQG